MKTQFEAIDKLIRDHTQADDFALAVESADSHETRFAQNAVTQHMVGANTKVSLVVSFGNRSGSAECNQTDEASLLQMLCRAEEAARCTQPDPEFLPSPGAQSLPSVSNYCDSTANLSGDEMLDLVEKSITHAQALDAQVSGMTERHINHFFGSTRNGFIGESAETTFSHSMTLKKGEHETKVSQGLKDYAQFDLDAQLRQLDGQFAALTGRKPLEPGRMAVILRPGAVLDFFSFMTYYMDRRRADEGLSCFSEQIDKPCFGEKFSLYSTFTQKDMVANPFSREYIASQETSWIERGVLKHLPTDRFWAQQQGLEPHDFFNIYIPGENATEEEMMKLVPRGVIVNRLWYIRAVDVKSGEYTGITRDGLVYFEDGQIRHAVNNMRFNEIAHECTKRLLALGPSVLVENYIKVPTMLIDGFNFVDTTSF